MTKYSSIISKIIVTAQLSLLTSPSINWSHERCYQSFIPKFISNVFMHVFMHEDIGNKQLQLFKAKSLKALQSKANQLWDIICSCYDNSALTNPRRSCFTILNKGRSCILNTLKLFILGCSYANALYWIEYWFYRNNSSTRLKLF